MARNRVVGKILTICIFLHFTKMLRLPPCTSFWVEMFILVVVPVLVSVMVFPCILPGMLKIYVKVSFAPPSHHSSLREVASAVSGQLRPYNNNCGP